MDAAALEELGLSKNEVKVYLALLESGSVTVGPLIKRTNLYKAPVYEALQRLLEKGLAKYIIKGGRKHFEAADPERLLDIIDERKRVLESILPELEGRKERGKIRQEAAVYEGRKAVKSIFEEILRTLKPGDEHVVFGVTTASLPFREYFNNVYKRMRDKGIKVRAIFSETGGYLEDFLNLPLTEVRTMPKEYLTPAAVNIYGNKTAIILWSENPMAFVVENKYYTASFKSYFDMLWDITKIIYSGKRGIEELLSQMLDTKSKEYCSYGGSREANRLMDDLFWKDLHDKRISKKINARLIFHESLKYWGDKLNEKRLTRVRYTKKEFEELTETIICGDRVAIIMWLEKPYGFLIKEKVVADSYKKFFEILWKSAKR